MKKTDEKFFNAKVAVVKAMHDYVVATRDEDNYDMWDCNVPENIWDGDFISIAKNDEMWMKVCDTFNIIINRIN